jgi:membrane complex biogenesis BtpA family protein
MPRLVGMCHLPPLPGTCSWHGDSLAKITEAALQDARTLEDAGFDAVLLQNSLDRPTRERVDNLTVAQMTAMATTLRAAVGITIGVNVIKNDGPAAMAIAAASGADFIRVKVLTGAVLSAEGIVTGCAAETHILQARAGTAVKVWADCYDPTSRPLVAADFEAAVADARDFGMADAVIVTGRDLDETLSLARDTRGKSPRVPIVIGGKADATSIRAALSVADAVIVGSALKREPGIVGRVDLECAMRIAKSAAEEPCTSND